MVGFRVDFAHFGVKIEKARRWGGVVVGGGEGST